MVIDNEDFRCLVYHLNLPAHGVILSSFIQEVPFLKFASTIYKFYKAAVKLCRIYFIL